MWEIFGDFNEGHLLFLGGWGSWVLFVLGLASLVVLTLSYLDMRPMRPRKRAWLLLALRASVLLVGLLAAAEPALELRDVERERNHVVFMLDGSRSMEVATPGGETRADRVVSAVQAMSPLFEGPQGDHIFDFFVFGGDVRATTARGLSSDARASDPEHTRMREAFETLIDELDDEPLGGVILMSDGIDDGAIGGRNRANSEALDEDTARYLEELGVPVHVFAAATREGLRDVAITRVGHDEFAFVRNRVAFDVELRGLGISGQGAQVELWADGERVRTQQVAFGSDDDTQSVTFEVVPERLGKAVYSVVVPPLGDEAIADNNTYHFAMNVIRDKIRVLQVCGQPSWDERFLRRLLKENPNVDLISFFILRTNSDLQLVPQDELSLIPFPKEELFEQELPGFDLVIFQNFNFGPYVYAHYLDRVADFVRGGGGFLMLGGELSFSGGGYYATPIGDLLPLELYPRGTGEGLVSTELFRPQLTQAGARHPITRLAFEAQENRRIWETLPLLEGSNIIRSVRPEATSLLTHPGLRDAAGQPMPISAVGTFGEGRTMAFTTDASWLWSFEYASTGGTARPYTQFWNNAIRWLIQDPELRLIQVEAPEQVEPGSLAVVRIEVLEPDYQPASGKTGTLRVTRDPLAGSRSGATELVLDEPFETDASGIYTFELQGDRPGVYEIHAEVEQDGVTSADEDLVLVARASQELRDVAPRNGLLRTIATVTQGRYTELPASPEALAALEFAAPKVSRINRRALVTLWDVWPVFVLLAGLLAVEWVLRRRWGRL